MAQDIHQQTKQSRQMERTRLIQKTSELILGPFISIQTLNIPKRPKTKNRQIKENPDKPAKNQSVFYSNYVNGSKAQESDSSRMRFGR